MTTNFPDEFVTGDKLRDLIHRKRHLSLTIGRETGAEDIASNAKVM